MIHAMSGEQDIRNMGGLSKKLKTTYWLFLIGCIAIAGILLFRFFSKDAILLSALKIIRSCTGLCFIYRHAYAFYMFRLLFITFGGKFRGTEDQDKSFA